MPQRLRPARKMKFALLSSFLPVLSARQLSPIFVLFLVGEQDFLFGAQITQADGGSTGLRTVKHFGRLWYGLRCLRGSRVGPDSIRANSGLPFGLKQRSEERRVGKECRSRWSPY